MWLAVLEFFAVVLYGQWVLWKARRIIRRVESSYPGILDRSKPGSPGKQPPPQTTIHLPENDLDSNESPIAPPLPTRARVCCPSCGQVLTSMILECSKCRLPLIPGVPGDVLLDWTAICGLVWALGFAGLMEGIFIGAAVGALRSPGAGSGGFDGFCVILLCSTPFVAVMAWLGVKLRAEFRGWRPPWIPAAPATDNPMETLKM